MEDLMEFTESQVLSAITWARQNLTKFPTIADLRINIEGSDEDHANHAWDAIIQCLSGGEHATVHVHDVVLAKTIETLWGHWAKVYRELSRIADDISRATAKRTFKLRYTEHYKHRSRLRQEMTAPVTFPGLPNPNKGHSRVYEPYYTINDDHTVSHETITIFPIERKDVPMPAELYERWEARNRRDNNAVSGSSVTPNLFGRLKDEPGTPGHDRRLRIDPDCAHLFDRDGKAIPAVPQRDDQGHNSDGSHDPIPGVNHIIRYCTCSGVRNGGECNCLYTKWGHNSH
jgi:hypothetical protein